MMSVVCVRVCMSTECACDHTPSSGVFAGIRMIHSTSDDCSYVRVESTLSPTLSTTLYIICSITILLSLLCSLFYATYARTAMIKRSAPLFLHLVNVAACMAAVCGIVTITRANSVTCNAGVWLGNLAFVMCFASLGAKVHTHTHHAHAHSDACTHTCTHTHTHTHTHAHTHTHSTCIACCTHMYVYVCVMYVSVMCTFLLHSPSSHIDISYLSYLPRQKTTHGSLVRLSSCCIDVDLHHCRMLYTCV